MIYCTYKDNKERIGVMVAGVGRGAHRKGATYESNIAKKLTKMFPGIEFHRTAYSGSTSNAGAQAGVNGFTGDLYILGDTQLTDMFSYELKNHSGMNLRQIFNNGATFRNFLQQNVADARRQDSIPVLIMHTDEREDVVTIPYQKDMYQFLVDNELPAMITHGRYTDDRTQVEDNFDLIVTSLKGFGAPTANELHRFYTKLDWDKYNKNNEVVEETIDVDKIVEEIDNEEES